MTRSLLSIGWGRLCCSVQTVIYHVIGTRNVEFYSAVCSRPAFSTWMLFMWGKQAYLLLKVLSWCIVWHNAVKTCELADRWTADLELELWVKHFFWKASNNCSDVHAKLMLFYSVTVDLFYPIFFPSQKSNNFNVFKLSFSISALAFQFLELSSKIKPGAWWLYKEVYIFAIYILWSGHKCVDLHIMLCKQCIL